MLSGTRIMLGHHWAHQTHAGSPRSCSWVHTDAHPSPRTPVTWHRTRSTASQSLALDNCQRSRIAATHVACDARDFALDRGSHVSPSACDGTSAIGALCSASRSEEHTSELQSRLHL